MGQITFQILLLNFVVAGTITAMLYGFCKPVRTCNPLLLFIVSSMGTFLGSILAMMSSTFNLESDSIILNHFITTLPGISLSLFFIFVWVKGAKSEGYV